MFTYFNMHCHKQRIIIKQPFHTAYYIKRSRSRTFRKSRPRTFTKYGPYTTIHCLSSRVIFNKFEGADFKYDNSFLNFYPKNTRIRHFWFQIQTFFVFLQNFAIRQIRAGEIQDIIYDFVLKRSHVVLCITRRGNI